MRYVLFEKTKELGVMYSGPYRTKEDAVFARAMHIALGVKEEDIEIRPESELLEHLSAVHEKEGRNEIRTVKNTN